MNTSPLLQLFKDTLLLLPCSGAKRPGRLRERFTFRWIGFEGQERRMGSQGLQAVLIGTLARCGKCRPTDHRTTRVHGVERASRSWLIDAAD